MAFKICVLLACVAFAQAGLIPSASQPELQNSEDANDPHPQYTFGYDIQDAVSGDSKNQYETRDGNSVRGQYSLIDADGLRRIVDYTSDSENGFNAVVRKEPIGAGVKEIAATPIARSGPAQVAYAPASQTLVSTQTPSSALVNPASNAIVKTSFSSPISSYSY